MGKLIYLMNVSLDGYVETPDHGLDWTNVDEELHGWFNEQMRRLDASLYGRRLYDTWERTQALLRGGLDDEAPSSRAPSNASTSGAALKRLCSMASSSKRKF